METQWGMLVPFQALLAVCLTLFAMIVVGLYGRNDPLL